MATADAPHAPRIAQTGAGNVAVLIVGDGNDVMVAGSCWKLWLRKLHLQAATPRKPLDLLIPQLQAIGFMGRKAERAALHAWLATDAPISVTGRIGEGGAGKTRLAIQLCAEAAAKGWDAGFARAEDLQTLDRHLDDGPVGWAGDVLMVVDYAARSTAVLKKLLRNLADRGPKGGPRLRILLLERHAATEIGWWHELFTPSAHADHPIPDLLAEPAPPPLPPLAATEAGPALFTATLEAMHRHFRTPLDEGRRRMADEIARRPTRWSALEIGMMAIIVAEPGAGDPVEASRPDLARHLARRELARIAEHDPPSPTDRFLGHLAALCTLEQGWSRTEALTILPEEWRALHMGGEPTTRALVERLGAALAQDGADTLPPVQPDLIGEALLIESARALCLAPDEVAATLDRAGERKCVPVLGAVVGLIGDFGAEAAPHTAWLRARAERTTDVDALQELADAMPPQTLELADLALAIQQRITALAAPRGGSEDELIAAQARRAASLNKEGNRLSNLGRREEALTATETAAAILRQLTECRPEVFLPHLARSLSDLGSYLLDLGRREEALGAAEEAAAILWRLVKVGPDAFPSLATSLNNLGMILSALGRREEALAATWRAVQCYHHLANACPEAFLTNLATSLNNLGSDLADFGRLDEALAATEDAVALRRKLAETRPDAFLPDLATSLINLGSRLSALGRREEAHAATSEAVLLYRHLFEARPSAFRAGLTTSLNNLGATLSSLGRRQEALATTVEVVALRRQLAEACPDAFRADLAVSLNNLGVQLSALAQWEGALAAIQEAVALRRELADITPDAFQPDLATSLSNLGTILSALAQREEALAAGAEAVALLRHLAQLRPDTFRSDLAWSLHNIGKLLFELGRVAEALTAVAEAVAIRRDLAEERPEAFRLELAQSLNGLGVLQSALNRHEEARATSSEAVAMLRKLAETQPETFRPDLAEGLHNLGRILVALGRQEEALAATLEAVALRRALAEVYGDAFSGALASSLNNLGAILSGLSHLEEALAAISEAVDIYRKLADARPDAFLPNLAVSLAARGQALRAGGRLGEARDAVAEAIAALRPTFLVHPRAVVHWMAPICRQYVERCELHGQEPDMALLAPIIEVFQRTSSSSPPDEGAA
jgi:tetratricopeptide (TPR) repeat protein